MSDETKRAKEIDDAVKEADAKRRADAEEAATAGEKLDNILSCLDALGKRMDAYDDARRKDADRLHDPTPAEKVYGAVEDGEEEEEKGDPKKLGADSRKDSRMVRKDSADAEEIEHYKREIGTTYAIAADSVLAHIQADADRASSAWGKSAVHPWQGESIVGYRRRVTRPHQQHSAAWKDVNLRDLDGQALRNATAQIFADSIAASTSPASVGESLREVRRRDPDTGHLVKEYYGEPRAWMSQFAGGPPRLARFNFAKNNNA
jgi:hypothetical protein